MAASGWGKKVHDFFKENDPYHRPTTALALQPAPLNNTGIKGYRTFDIAAREIYERQGWPINKTSTIDSATVNPLTSSYTNYAGEIGKLWQRYDRPVILGETGWDHTFYEPSMPGYLAQYHNALWVYALLRERPCLLFGGLIPIC